MFQLLSGRGSAPPLFEKPAFDRPPARVERVRTIETLDLYHGVRSIDEQLITITGGAHLASDDAFGAAEEADHACTIGYLDRVDRGWYPATPYG
jgi:hypothetical protein